MQVLLEGDLLRRVWQLERAEPAQVRGCPRALARVGDAVTQQERLETVTRIVPPPRRLLEESLRP